ncbi:hypothetical protein [Brachybacterium hainanense]|uniref:VOC domain-containing protein n=1 Tax=Brachybacterium hainanense TaxID=1541174 RepID=A0ABV6RAT5_9MICO
MTSNPDGSAARTPFHVYPLRFTAHPAAMITFLRTLGLAPQLTAGDGTFGELHAGAGRVMVHSASGSEGGARSGDTDLCLAVPDTMAAAAELREAGLAVRTWDETYGKQGVVAGPAGESIGLNEDQEDTYGYEGHDPSGADPRLEVVAVLSSDDFARDAAWFARFGFLPAGEGDEHWQALRGPGRAGTIGLHAPIAGDAGGRRTRGTGSEFGSSLQVRLGFETSEDLEALARRLADAGYAAHLVEGAPARSVHVTDPDGTVIEVHMSEGA